MSSKRKCDRIYPPKTSKPAQAHALQASTLVRVWSLFISFLGGYTILFTFFRLEVVVNISRGSAPRMRHREASFQWTQPPTNICAYGVSFCNVFPLGILSHTVTHIRKLILFSKAFVHFCFYKLMIQVVDMKSVIKAIKKTQYILLDIFGR